MSRTRATTCKVCGAPRNTREGAAGSQLLCEKHLLEYWQDKKGTRRNGQHEAETVVTGQAIVKRETLNPPSADTPVIPQVTVTIESGRATLSVEEFWTLLRAASPPEKDSVAQRVTRKLALVSTNGLQVVLYEAVPRGMQNLPDTGDGPDYLKRFEELRAAGFTVALVG